MMKVSTRTRYGLRALAMLAATRRGGPMSLRAIAEAAGLPVKYLERLFSRLKAARVVRSRRGAGGGYKLARPPEEIPLLEVFEVLEGPPDPVDCLDPAVVCPHRETCATRDLWQEVSDAVSRVLAGHTLADLVGEPVCEEESRG